MNAIDQVMALARRYAPTLLAHLILLLWLSLFVLKPGAWDGTSVWALVSNSIDNTFEAVGLSLERWYGILALLIAYLTAFEWLRRLVLSLPVLRIRLFHRFRPHVLARACRVMALEPDLWKVDRTVSDQIDRALERVRQKGQSDPYEGMIDRRIVLTDYYGAALIGVVAMVTWAVVDPSYAWSAGRIWLTALGLAACALGLRWVIARQFANYLDAAGHWALSEFERNEPAPAEDRLREERSERMLRLALEEAAYRRHPASIVTRMLAPLPPKWREWLRERIRYPELARDGAWKMTVSSRTRFAEEKIVPPAALRAQAFVPRFESLLERDGTGLFMLAPPRSALAPAAPEGGSVYSFEERRHDLGGVGIRYEIVRGADGTDCPQLALSYATRGFIAAVGQHPIEKLLIGEWPVDGKQWYRFAWELPEASLLPPDNRDGVTIGGVELRRSAKLEWGSSYLVGADLGDDTRAGLVLQCFRVAGGDRLLAAWAFLDLDRGPMLDWPEPGERLLPWSRPSAWKGLFSNRPGTS